MPTALPRLPVTLTAAQRDLLAKVAALNGTSQSKVIAELLDAAAPVLLRIVAALENVKRLDAEKADLIRATIVDAQAEAEQTAATALALLERIGRAGGTPRVDVRSAPPEDADGSLDAISPPPRRRRPPTANRGGENRGGTK